VLSDFVVSLFAGHKYGNTGGLDLSYW
jgi:hypothetical protein